MSATVNRERMRRLAHRGRAGSKGDVLMVNVHVRYWRVVVGGLSVVQ
jgi:hypothetical protein